MSYKTILVHADASRHADIRYQVAGQLALAHGAHLIGAAMTGVSRFLPPEAVELTGFAVAELLDHMHATAQRALERFGAAAAAQGLPSYETRLVNDDADGGLALQARYADLLVVSQFDPDSTAVERWSDLPEYLFMSTARPVLVLPLRSHCAWPPRHALVCWDGSLEATRALTSALPLLQAVPEVSVLVLNPDRAGDHGPEPGADIALYLSRHGVKVNVRRRETEQEAGTAILAQARRLSAELIVMGGYGHSRFRELMIGGATRTVLGSATVPVLFAH